MNALLSFDILAHPLSFPDLVQITCSGLKDIVSA